METCKLAVMREADNGDEAISLVRRERPDVVLMDITMPVLDGFKATVRLPELLAVLENEVQDLWEEAGRMLVINDVEALGERAGELGGEYGFGPLADWGSRLQVEASTFQMDAIPKTLEEFSGVVGQLRTVV